eukprot:TRINITY_DN3137_c0_g1_i1.p2 TRINITY_DN3137_c0_g1~~TRINITY_DN3137_c0_g1_i1.p2  ORF type:complete len:143 (-),score=2.69 TRINITY_DN3137_c0_g1_i1:16-444(-)
MPRQQAKQLTMKSKSKVVDVVFNDVMNIPCRRQVGFCSFQNAVERVWADACIYDLMFINGFFGLGLHIRLQLDLYFSQESVCVCVYGGEQLVEARGTSTIVSWDSWGMYVCVELCQCLCQSRQPQMMTYFIMILNQICCKHT